MSTTHHEPTTPPTAPDRLLNAAEVAELLHVPETWVRETTRAGHIPHLRLGRYIRYQHHQIDAWLQTLTAGHGPRFRKHHPH